MVAARPVLRDSARSRTNLALAHGMNRQISSEINNLTQQGIQEIARPKDKYQLKEFKELLEAEPLSKACVELKALRAVSSFGDFEHEDKESQRWIRDNFETMRGSVKTTIREMTSALPFGFACAEWNPSSGVPGKFGEWRLESINPLDPEKVTFAGHKGKITHVVYKEGGGKRYIPYWKCLHITNGISHNSPYGSAEARRAMPYYKAKQILFAEMLVAGKNSATGILLAQADSNDRVQLLGGDNQPMRNLDGTPKIVTGVDALLYQLQNLDSSGICATDLKNRVSPLLIPSGDNFWNFSIMLVKKEILLSFLTPSLIWDEGSFGGLGNTGMSGNHKNTLDANIAAIVEQLQEEILEKIVRWLLVHNKPKKVWQRNYGAFKAQATSDPSFVAMQASNLIAAISSQILPSSDTDVINALREAVGVPPVNQQQMMQFLQQQIQMQAMQQQGLTDPAAADPNAAPAGSFSRGRSRLDRAAASNRVARFQRLNRQLTNFAYW